MVLFLKTSLGKKRILPMFYLEVFKKRTFHHYIMSVEATEKSLQSQVFTFLEYVIGTIYIHFHDSSETYINITMPTRLPNSLISAVVRRE